MLNQILHSICGHLERKNRFFYLPFNILFNRFLVHRHQLGFSLVSFSFGIFVYFNHTQKNGTPHRKSLLQNESILHQLFYHFFVIVHSSREKIFDWHEKQRQMRRLSAKHWNVSVKQVNVSQINHDKCASFLRLLSNPNFPKRTHSQTSSSISIFYCLHFMYRQ